MTMFANRRLFTIAALAATTALAACGGGNDAGNSSGTSGPRTQYERTSDRAIGSVFGNDSTHRYTVQDHLKSVFEKMAGSGLKVIWVPVRSDVPIALSGRVGTPRRYS